jgi:ankyrin repeat protein
MSPNYALMDAAMHGDYEKAADALRRGANANDVFNGGSPLFWAAQEGYTEIVDLLLNAGADVNFADPGGFTPLKQAVGDSHLDIVERLLLRGANIGHRCATDGGSTVLHTAAAYGLVDCIRLLLRYGADPKALSDDGQTPYDTAIECEERDAAALLRISQVA